MQKSANQKINIITLGCSKNLVDTEVLRTQIEKSGVEVLHNSNDTSAKTVIINTCGFIADSQEESIDTILNAIATKKNGHIDNVYVMGCLSERYKKDLQKEMPDVDQYFGVNDLSQILETLKIDYKKELIGERNILTPSHFAYLKISEGCNRSCSFCAIPLIRGKHISRPIEELVREAELLVKKGVKEILLIAQDLSYYGFDLYKKFKLAELLEKLSDIKGLEWIRLHYIYPANFPEEVIQVMKTRENICKYIDIPIQHIADNMLTAMRRGHSKKSTLELIHKFRTEIPDIAIRTTLLVGHPNETDEDFAELMQFVEDSKFERLGVFTYSAEKDTHSYENMKDDVDDSTKTQRADAIMELQSQIAAQNNRKLINTVQKVLIDNEDDDFYIGRTQYDSPEVDNEVLIEKAGIELTIGKFYNVKITDAEEYDLFGELMLPKKHLNSWSL